MITFNLHLAGFGHVGRRFVRMLDESSPALHALGLATRVVGITTGRHGGMFDPAGIDAVRAAATVESGGSLGPDADVATSMLATLCDLDDGTPVLIETTPLNVETAEPAMTHVRAALERGIHVITANKGPVALAWAEIDRLAASHDAAFLFEGAVMDGIPIFNLVRETLPACEIRAFRGVVNSTTNFIITALEAGEPFDAALARMQAAGVAERDASLDVDGWDAATKAAAMANVWLGANTTPARVAREGIGPSTAHRALDALSQGRRLKLVASGRRTASGADVSVRLEALDADDPLARLDGQANALELDTWPAGRIVITQRDGGLEKTAYALVSDLVALGRRLAARS